MATVTEAQEQRLFLSNVSWTSYEQLLEAFQGQRGLRITYDRGNLELMTVSPPHERGKKLLARFVEAYTEELDIPIVGLGNCTFKREDAARGLEPDECWYIRHEALMREKDEIDLTVDPPPELAIEIEITRGIIDKVSVYEALGVPEIWRYDGEQRLRVMVLGADGRYAESDHSPTFPQLPISKVVEFLMLRGQMDETRLVKAFRAWVRVELLGKVN